MSEQKPAMHCGDALDCCSGDSYPACQDPDYIPMVKIGTSAIGHLPASHYEDDQPTSSAFKFTD